MILFKKKVGIIGYGNMGSIIAERIRNRYNVFIFDRDTEKTKNIRGVRVVESIVNLLEESEVIIIAVKPQDFDVVLSEIREFAKNKLIVSIAAGITTAYIEKIMGDVKVIRAMPNLPAKFGEGLTWLCRGKFATWKDLKLAISIFSNLGTTFSLPEDNMDVATAISGSGPGFFYDLIEGKPKEEWEEYGRNYFVPQLASAAKDSGIEEKTARLAADITFRGSLVTVQNENESPSQLKKRVASKGGTTEAGLEQLHKTGSLKEAILAAKRRAQELSK